jgi:hypothetical protein
VADIFDCNHGGATHPGARAIVHPAAKSDEHVVRYRVVAESDEHITLDDGYTYDKRTGVVRGPAGHAGTFPPASSLHRSAPLEAGVRQR